MWEIEKGEAKMVRQIYLSPRKEWEGKRVLERLFLVLWKVKEKEERSAFRLAGFFLL